MTGPLRSRRDQLSRGSGRLSLIAALAAFASLWLAVELVSLERASAQAATPGLQSFPNFTPSPASQLGAAIQPPGIPLGSTELAIPGTSPVLPQSGASMSFGNENCFIASKPGAVFDGGGLPGNSSTGCGARGTTSIVRPTTSTSSSVGLSGVPLGSTELGSAGLSPALSLPLPMPSPPTGSSPPAEAMPCPTDGTATTTAAPGGC
jgi:hypothetical protein